MKKRIISMIMASAVVLFTMAVITGFGKKTTPRIYTIGDSTMASNKDSLRGPGRGWGHVFWEYFDGITIENHASGGQSTKSFRTPGPKDRWTPVIKKVKRGDYVYIQFGHNDPKPDSARHADPEAFALNLENYVKEVRKKGGNPVLLTSIERRIFNNAGVSIRNTHEGYTEKYYELREKLNVPVIDLNKLSNTLLLAYGDEPSKKFFNYVEPGVYEAYPDGNKDNTHLNILGARVIAGMVAIETAKLFPELAPHIRSVKDLAKTNPEFREVEEAIKIVYSKMK
ncbi:MAG: rhamnogalacturonan acetylesterase [Mangrovibacterium sp.]